MHSINIVIIKKSEIRTSKIESLLDNKKISVSNLELPQGMLAFPDLYRDDVCKHFGDGVSFIQVSTDYFGGMGEQSAKLCLTTKKGFKMIKSSDSINSILKEYGVVCDNSDEFDAINLGRYRTNSDFEEEINQ